MKIFSLAFFFKGILFAASYFFDKVFCPHFFGSGPSQETHPQDFIKGWGRYVGEASYINKHIKKLCNFFIFSLFVASQNLKKPPL